MLILTLLGSLNIEEGHVTKLGQPMDICGYLFCGAYTHMYSYEHSSYIWRISTLGVLKLRTEARAKALKILFRAMGTWVQSSGSLYRDCRI